MYEQRGDGHVQHSMRRDDWKRDRGNPDSNGDCLHYCVPGIPLQWNHMLHLLSQANVWRTPCLVPNGKPTPCLELANGLLSTPGGQDIKHLHFGGSLLRDQRPSGLMSSPQHPDAHHANLQLTLNTVSGCHQRFGNSCSALLTDDSSSLLSPPPSRACRSRGHDREGGVRPAGARMG